MHHPFLLSDENEFFLYVYCVVLMEFQVNFTFWFRIFLSDYLRKKNIVRSLFRPFGGIAWNVPCQNLTKMFYEIFKFSNFEKIILSSSFACFVEVPKEMVDRTTRETSLFSFVLNLKKNKNYFVKWANVFQRTFPNEMNREYTTQALMV